MPDFLAVRKVLAKELREARRDRNLVFNVVLVPLFLYPLLGFGVLQVLQVVRGIGEREGTVVELSGPVPAAVRDSLARTEGVVLVDVPGAEAPADGAGFRAHRAARAGAGLPAPHALLHWEGPGARLFHDGAQDRSRAAKQAVEDAVDSFRRARAESILASAGLPPGELDRFTVTSENTASAVQRGRQILASGLPLILLLMLAVGTAAAALDTVVGERERGTLETILVSPLARADVFVGKYLFVVTAAVTAFTLNLASMSVFLGFVLELLDVGEEIRVSIDPLSFVLVSGAAVLTAAFLAAVFMIIAVPSRTYREGQAALSPAYLLAMVPGLVVGASREPFGLSQAFIPVLNACALFEAALLGPVDAAPVVVTFAVLAFVTLAALVVAARLVSREDAFLEPKLSLRRLLRGGGS